jgi:hypothetical protein
VTRSNVDRRISRARARVFTTIWSWSTRRRSSALAASRRPRAASSPTPPDYGNCVSHSRYFWGVRLHGLFALDGTPRVLLVTLPKTPERSVCLTLPAERAPVGAPRQRLRRTRLRTKSRRTRRDNHPATTERRKPPAGCCSRRSSNESSRTPVQNLLTLEGHGAKPLHGLGATASEHASSPSQPRSRSTTDSADRRARSATHRRSGGN